MNEEKKRKQAIELYEKGEKPSSISKSLDRSRRWVYKWIKRYEQCEKKGNWYIEKSRAPKTKPGKISEQTEQQILAFREKLENNRYSQTGAISILYEFKNNDLEPPPIWTINRVLSRRGLTKKKKYKKSSVEYPELYIDTHQMDLIGPRYIKGDGRFYCLNIIDLSCHTCHIEPVRTKSSKGIINGLAEFWRVHGLPDALQMDNELAFRGSNRYPRSFGSVVRFALSQQVSPVFIPVKEPWRNGVIERFNQTFGKRFLKTKTFVDFSDLKDSAKEFISFHNSYHRYSSQGQKTPQEMKKGLLPPLLYSKDTHKMERIPLETGCVYFVRFIRSDLKLKLPTESFKVHPSLKYSYIIAQINIDNHCLNIIQNQSIIQSFEYILPVDW